jgi:hypothetical protein
MTGTEPRAAREPVIYWIDRADTILRVNDAWDAFALANDAPELVADRVTGESLWQFVVESTTRHLYRQMMVRVRAGAFLRFALRCDSPRLKRRLSMTISPDGDCVRYETHVIGEEPHAGVKLWQRNAQRRDDFVRVCSWCNRVEDGNLWIEVEEAIRRNGMFEEPVPPTLTHGICPQCQKAFELVIDTRTREV